MPLSLHVLLAEKLRHKSGRAPCARERTRGTPHRNQERLITKTSLVPHPHNEAIRIPRVCHMPPRRAVTRLTRRPGRAPWRSIEPLLALRPEPGLSHNVGPPLALKPEPGLSHNIEPLLAPRLELAP
ncbi:MAG TPA: hypothetical protein VG028_18510 [Terriglobia bacterium]|nr:hypothetical protein [Terriglobia bacterium]